MLAQGKSNLPTALSRRITYIQHDFFQTQPAPPTSPPPAAFLLRQVTHNWSDRDAEIIIRSLVPGLEASPPGTPLLINDAVLSAGAGLMPPHQERLLRQMDMLMMIGLGSKQRTAVEFEALLKKADSRFRVVRVHAEGALGLVEARIESVGTL